MNRFLSRLKQTEIGDRGRCIAQFGKQFINFGCRIGFVGFQNNDVVGFEKILGRFRVQSEPLCCFTRRSPISGEVNKHRPPLFQMLFQCEPRIGLIVQFVLWNQEEEAEPNGKRGDRGADRPRFQSLWQRRG